MNNFQIFLGTCALIATPFAIFEVDKYFTIKRAAAERAIFEETKSYNDGMVRDCENLMLQYNSSNQEQKEVLKATILHRFSVYPSNKMPSHILSFYQKLQSGAL